MKKIEIYTSREDCQKLTEVLEEEKLYWYAEDVRLKGGEKICRVTVYAPLHAIEEIVAGVSEALDMRKAENMVAVSDVEASMDAPYRITRWRFLSLANSFAKRPRFMLLEDAGERSRVSSAQVNVTMYSINETVRIGNVTIEIVGDASRLGIHLDVMVYGVPPGNYNAIATLVFPDGTEAPVGVDAQYTGHLYLRLYYDAPEDGQGNIQLLPEDIVLRITIQPSGLAIEVPIKG